MKQDSFITRYHSGQWSMCLHEHSTGWRHLRTPLTGWRRLRTPLSGWRRLRTPLTGWRRLRTPLTGCLCFVLQPLPCFSLPPPLGLASISSSSCEYVSYAKWCSRPTPSPASEALVHLSLAPNSSRMFWEIKLVFAHLQMWQLDHKEGWAPKN